MSDPQQTILGRAVRILETCKTASRPLTASEIGRRTGIPVASAHRIVGELVALRILERDPERRIRIGARLWEIASRATHDFQRMREIARPHLEELCAATGFPALISVLDGNDVLNVDTTYPPVTSALNITHQGVRLPALASSPGLVLVAMGGRHDRERILRDAKLVAFTEHTVVDKSVLVRILDDTARRGSAVVSEWMTPGSVGIAVPVIGRANSPLAALSVTIGVDTLPVPGVLSLLHRAAAKLSRCIDTARKPDDLGDPRGEYLMRQVLHVTGEM